jgi:hypothetical protein
MLLLHDPADALRLKDAIEIERRSPAADDGSAPLQMITRPPVH